MTLPHGFAQTGPAYEALTFAEADALVRDADEAEDVKVRIAALSRLGRAGIFAPVGWRPSALTPLIAREPAPQAAAAPITPATGSAVSAPIVEEIDLSKCGGGKRRCHYGPDGHCTHRPCGKRRQRAAKVKPAPSGTVTGGAEAPMVASAADGGCPKPCVPSQGSAALALAGGSHEVASVAPKSATSRTASEPATAPAIAADGVASQLTGTAPSSAAASDDARLSLPQNFAGADPTLPESSNGTTPDFESGDDGSSPSSGTTTRAARRVAAETLMTAILLHPEKILAAAAGALAPHNDPPEAPLTEPPIPPASSGVSQTVGTVGGDLSPSATVPAAYPISRRSYLGSADIPMVVGVSTFGGPWHVWASKCEDLPEDESEHLRIGLELEEGIARLWAWKNGATLIGKGSLVLHPDDPRTGATVDYWARLVDGRVGIVECKNVGPGGRANWSDDDGDVLPQSVTVQTTWQMGHALAAGCRCDFIAVAKLEFGCRVKSAWVDYDPEMFDLLLAEGRAFWSRHVETNTPPPLDGSDAATAHLERRWPKSNGAWLEATDERAALVRALKDAKAATKEAARVEEEAEQRVLVAIGEADGIKGLAKWGVEAGRASWKKIAEAVAAGEPLGNELIGAHTGKGSRTLRLLGGK